MRESNIEDIDRALKFEIDRQLIAAGYLPDKDTFIAAGDATGYEAARQTKLDADELAECMGVGNVKGRGELVHNRIVISRGLRTPSETNMVGGEICYEPYDDNGETKYNELLLPEVMEDQIYNVRVITNDIKWDRRLDKVVTKALGTRKYLSEMFLDPSDNTRKPVGEDNIFLLERLSVQDLSGADFMERLYVYEAKNLILEPFIELNTNIAEATDITIETAASTEPIDPDSPEDVPTTP